MGTLFVARLVNRIRGRDQLYRPSKLLRAARAAEWCASYKHARS